MIETIDNVIQLVLTGFAAAYSIMQAMRLRNREWAIFAMFCTAFFLGTLHWELFFVFYGYTPLISYVSDFSWYSAYLFITLFVRQLQTEEEHNIRKPAMYAIPVFVTGMAVFYIVLKGDIFGNIICAAIFGRLIWLTAQGLYAPASERTPVYRVTMAYCILEYALWTFSCFNTSTAAIDPYYVLDIMLSLCFIPFILSLRKAVNR